MIRLRHLTPTRAQLFTATLIASAMGLSVAAVSLPNTFTAGTAARAADINANFAALKAAVDALQTDLATANGKVTALETKLAGVGSNAVVPGKNGVTAYLWAHDPTAAQYTPTAGYAFNSTGGAISVTRQSTGLYRVTMAGVAANGVGTSGNVQVTAYNSLAVCNVLSWVPAAAGSPDLAVNVRCTDLAGTVVDSLFSAIFIA